MFDKKKFKNFIKEIYLNKREIKRLWLEAIGKVDSYDLRFDFTGVKEQLSVMPEYYKNELIYYYDGDRFLYVFKDEKESGRSLFGWLTVVPYYAFMLIPLTIVVRLLFMALLTPFALMYCYKPFK